MSPEVDMWAKSWQRGSHWAILAADTVPSPPDAADTADGAVTNNKF